MPHSVRQVNSPRAHFAHIHQREKVNGVFARYYLVGRADIDSDGDGIPDAREIFVYNTDPAKPPVYIPAETNSAESALDKDNASTNGIPVPPPVARWVVGRIIYVDKKLGSDALSGRRPIIVDQDGPKKTIKAGLTAADAGDTLIIKGGWYDEDLNDSGRNISVIIKGHVDLSARRFPRKKDPKDDPVEILAPTNSP